MLINSVQYEHGKRVRDVGLLEEDKAAKAAGGFVWVALKDASPEELDLVQSRFDLHELAVEDTRTGQQRPKIEEYGDSLFFVMQLIKVVDGQIRVGHMHVFVGPQYVVSVRSGSEHSFVAVRARAEREPDLLEKGSAFVAYALLDTVSDSYVPVLDAFELELDQIERQIFEGGQARESIQQLYELKHRVGELRHAVTPLMEALSKLHGGRVHRLCAPLEEYFRDVYDHLYRIHTTITAMQDTIRTAIQVNLSVVTIEEGEVTKRLAAWAAIGATVPAMASIWGMNFKVMPDLEWAYGYPTALGLMAAVCGLLYVRFRRAQWL